MDLKNSATVLFVNDISVSKNFYSELLEIPIDLDFGKNIIFKGGFAIWEINKDHIIPQSLSLNKIIDRTVNRFELYFETDTLDEVFEKLKSIGVKFLHEIHEEIWGQRTIRFFDPDNHLIEIGESMQKFITRFYKQGMSVEQISQRTHVPVSEVNRLLKT